MSSIINAVVSAYQSEEKDCNIRQEVEKVLFYYTDICLSESVTDIR